MSRSTLRLLVLAALAAAPAAAQAPGPLMSAAWLAQHVREANIVMLQVGPRPSYDKEHIAGSRFVQLSDIATSGMGGLALEMLPPDTLRARLEKLGVSDGSRIVVVFTDEWVSPSTRVLFTLQYAGLGDQAFLLDGGLGAWKRAGGAVTADVPAAPGHAHLHLHVDSSLVVDYAYVQSHAHTPRLRLVDARDAEFYSGPPHTSMSEMAPGHIPGAVSVPFTTLTDDSMKLLPRAALEQRFLDAGVAPGDTVVAYCHVGQQATVVVLAARLTGRPARLYDGSMHDWTNRKLPTEGGR